MSHGEIFFCTISDALGTVIYERNREGLSDLLLPVYETIKDEVGVMAIALYKMQNSIREFIISTSDTSEKVVASAEELTATSQYIAMNSNKVAKTIEEIANGASEQAGDAEVSFSNVEDMGLLLEKNRQYLDELNQATNKINNEASQIVYEITVKNQENAEKIEIASGMINSKIALLEGNNYVRKVERSL